VIKETISTSGLVTQETALKVRTLTLTAMEEHASNELASYKEELRGVIEGNKHLSPFEILNMITTILEDNPTEK
jgi:hypothetical protein